MSDFRVQGADQLDDLAKRLKAAGNGDLRKELLRGIRETNKPTISDIRASARSRLPHGGGLADTVARASIGTRTRLSGKSVGVEIKGTSWRLRNLRSINAGRLRHPLFGNREHFFVQPVEPGFFDEPIEKRGDEILRGIEDVMADVARRVAK